MISEEQYQQAASSLGVTVAHIKAFAEVESRGEGFLPDGRPKILFERHVFYKRLAQAKSESYAAGISQRFPDICNKATGGYVGGAVEHDRLAKAVSIDRTAALESASWGAFQVMGFNWKTCGYDGIQPFVNAAYKEAGQLDILVRFLKGNPAIVTAMKSKNWARVAELYNGRDYAKNKYDTKLAAAFKKFGGV